MWIDEPYSIDDNGWGWCPVCNASGLELTGAASSGDGDLYDELYCPLCREIRGRANPVYFGLDGQSYDDVDERNQADALYERAVARAWRLVKRLGLTLVASFVSAGLLRLVGVLGSTWPLIGLMAFGVLGLYDLSITRPVRWDWAAYFRRGRRGG